MRKKILFITNRFVIGGPAFHVADLACKLQSDFDIRIMGGEAAKGEETNIDMFKGLENEPIFLFNFSRKFNLINDLKSYRQIKSYIRDFKPDIVHTHTSKPGILGRIAAWRLNVPIIIHTFHGHLFYGYFSNSISRLIILLERWMAKKTDIIIALSSSQAEDLSGKFRIAPASKISVILPGISLSRIESKPKDRKKFRIKYNFSDEVLVLGIVGRLVQIKNIMLFIDGIKYLIDNNVNIKGIIVGDGPEKRNLKDYCISIGLTFAEFCIGNQNEQIVFASWQKNLGKLYQGLDGIALTSINEGTPYSVIEAQMAGTKVIAADVGGVKDIVIPDKSAFLFNSKEDYFKKLLIWATNEGDRKVSDETSLWAKNLFSANRMAAETKKIYNELIQLSKMS